MLSSRPILVAVPIEWSSQVCEHLKQHGFPVIATHSQEETLAMASKPEDLRGMIIVSDWAMSTENNENSNIIKLVKGKIPTVTLITETSRQQSGYRYMEEIFFPPSHDYATVPFDLDELTVRMQHVGMI